MGPADGRLASVTAILCDVRPGSPGPCLDIALRSSRSPHATFLAVIAGVFWLWDAGLRGHLSIRTYVRVSSSAQMGILRTHVPLEHSLPANATGAQCALPGPLVPVARG